MKPTAQKDQWYNIATNAAKTHADIYLYGVVGYGVTVNRFMYELGQAGKLKTINVYINTIGGTFYDGLPIYNMLKQHAATVTTINMGYALSMGSVLLLAGDQIQMAANALIMIHPPQGYAYGDADEMEHEAKVLRKHESGLLPDYMKRLGKTEDEVKALLKAETWYTAAEAKAAGMIDSIVDEVDLDEQDADLSENSWKFAAKHFSEPHEVFSQRMNAQINPPTGQRPNWLQRMIGAVANHPQPPKSDDDDMTPEQFNELKGAITAGNKELADSIVSGLAAALKPAEPETPAPKAEAENEANALADVTAERDQLQSKVEALEAEIAELKKPSGNEDLPDNTGDSEGWDADF